MDEQLTLAVKTAFSFQFAFGPVKYDFTELAETLDEAKALLAGRLVQMAEELRK